MGMAAQVHLDPASRFSGVPPSQCCRDNTKVLKNCWNNTSSFVLLHFNWTKEMKNNLNRVRRQSYICQLNIQHIYMIKLKPEYCWLFFWGGEFLNTLLFEHWPNRTWHLWLDHLEGTSRPAIVGCCWMFQKLGFSEDLPKVLGKTGWHKTASAIWISIDFHF